MKYNFDEIIDRNNTASLKHDFKGRYCGNSNAIPMWVADMDFKTPDFIVDAVIKRAQHGVLGYTVKDDEFYQSVIDWMKLRYNWTIQRDWISLSPGVVPALNVSVFAFTDPGDKVIVQTPVYAPFFKAVTEQGRELCINELKNVNGRYKMDLEHFESLIDERTKLFLLCSPHNPVGRVWTKEELIAVGKICLKHNIIIASDEIHSDLALPGYQHFPLAQLSDELAQSTITFMAPSKTFNMAGLTSSVIISSNKQLLARYNKFPERLELPNGNLFGITALQAAYRNGNEWLGQMLDYIQINVDYLGEFITNRLPKIKMIQPEGTFLIWLDCRGMGMTDRELHDFFFNKAQVALSRGTDFGQGGSGFMRINLGCPLSVLKTALEQIEKAFIA